MSIEKNYYIQDGKLYFSVIDFNVVYHYEWSKENLVIKDNIALNEINKEKIIKLKEDFKKVYHERINNFYNDKKEEHMKNGLKSIDEFFLSILEKETK